MRVLIPWRSQDWATSSLSSLDTLKTGTLRSGTGTGSPVLGFLADPPRSVPVYPRSPFYAGGSWYLPVLRPDYDPEDDNLILMDATSDRFLGQILDEMATYGCRYARVVLITQEALEERPERRTLHRYPIGHALRLPALYQDGRERPIPDLALPLVLNLLSMAMASETGRGKGRRP